jgi:HAMP domain-containing protein
MEWALTDQLRNFSRVAVRLNAGKADTPITVECHGETGVLKNALNGLLEKARK